MSLDLAPDRRRWAAFFMAVLLASVAATLTIRPAAAATTFKKNSCAPLDLAFVVDDTGSMGGALDNVKAGLNNIIADAQTVGGANLRLSLVAFGTDVRVLVPFANNNVAAEKAGVNSLVANGGGGEPEASDEAVNTAVNALKASDRSAGQQTGDFTPGFRSGGEKILVLITDAHPAGFNDTFTSADVAHVKKFAKQAGAKKIRIASIYVPTGTSEPDEVKIMKSWASLSGGEYRKTKADGKGTSAAIEASIASCAGKKSAKKKLRVTSSPKSVPAGSKRCITFTVTNKSTHKAVKGAKVKFAGRSKRTNRKGHARFCLTFSSAGRRGVSGTRSGYTRGTTGVFVTRRPRFTG